MDCEFLAAYLGLPGIICLLLLLAATAFLLLTRQEAKISGWFWLILSIFSFSVIGGLNGIIGLGKFYLLRGSNRFSIFILAAGFFFLATLFTRNRNRLGKVASYGIALLFIGLAIGESALRMSPARNSGPEAISLEKDRSYFLKLEAELPKGAMLFNYPPDRFPAGPLNYPELRGYIASENLRFSYGSIAGRAREAWQSEVAALPAKEMVERLQALGFSGILVYINGDLNREGNAGLKDATFQKLGELRELGLAEINDRTGSFVFLKITPASNPAYPEAPVYFTKGFWSEAIQKPNVIQPSPLRWAAQSDCIIEIFNEQKQPRFAILLGNLIGTQASQLDILYKNESLWKSEIQKSEKTDFQTKPILVPPQTHARFRIKCNTPPLFTDGRKFSFGISKVVIKWENKEQPPITSSPNIPNIFCFRNVPYEENSF